MEPKKVITHESRNSTIELLKVVAIIFIVISHSLPRYGEQGVSYHEFKPGIDYFIQCVMLYGGQLGNSIFIVATCFFLTKRIDIAPLRKITPIAFDTISLSYLRLMGG